MISQLQPQRLLLTLLSVVAILSSAAPRAGAQGFTQIIAITDPTKTPALSGFTTPVLNDAGQVAFIATLTGTSGGTSDDTGIYRGTGGPLTEITRERPAGGVTSGLTALVEPALNGAGQAAFGATFLQGLIFGGAELDGVFRGSGGSLTTIALENNTAPGGNGTFSYLEEPALNNAGQAAFVANLAGTSGGTSDDDGIFRGAGGAITPIVRAGQAAPDGNGVFSSFYQIPTLNENGEVAFRALLTGTSGGFSDSQGIFRGAGSAITQIARTAQPAPDGNGTISALNVPALNDAGQAAFRAELEGTSGGSTDQIGIFRGAGGAITQIARAGQPAPNINGAFFDNFGTAALNNAGQAAFWAKLTGSSSDEGVYRGAGGPLTQIARQGQSAPDGNGTFSQLFAPALNEGGQVAFFARLTGTIGGSSDNEGIFLNNGLDILQIARLKQALGGSTITALYFHTNSSNSGDERSGFNELGQVAFLAHLANGEQVIALWTPPALVGNYNGDGVVNAADYVVWRKTLGQTGINLAADGNGNQIIDTGDFNVWRAHFGQMALESGSGSAGAAPFQNAVPESATWLMLLTALLTLCLRRRAIMS